MAAILEGVAFITGAGSGMSLMLYLTSYLDIGASSSKQQPTGQGSGRRLLIPSQSMAQSSLRWLTLTPALFKLQRTS